MLSENYRPATFVERGVAIAFTTPALQFARARTGDRDDFELLIGGFTGDRTIYVLPFKAIAETFNLTVHDRALVEDIVINNVRSPHAMRLATYRVALTGLAGAAARGAARQGLDAEKDGELLTQYLLTSRVLELGGFTAQQVAQLIAAGKNDARIRREVKSAAVRLNIDPDKLNPYIDEISRFAYPSGLPSAPVPGPLRRLLERLKQFIEHLDNFIESTKSERANIAAFAKETAVLTVGLADETLANFDKRIGNITKETFQVPTIRAMRQDCERISWLVDGWEDILVLYYGDHPETRPPPSSHVMRILDPLFLKLPIVPTKEVSLDAESIKEAPTVSRRSVKASEDWRTGEMDLDTVLRIEQMKARVLKRAAEAKDTRRG